jgi:uncharacterized protein
MPVSDRDYMRRSAQPSRGGWKPGGSEWFVQNPVLVIIVLNIVMYMATTISGSLAFNLSLVPALFLEKPWTIITNMFVHAGFWHIFGNMLTLFFFGRVLFQIVGIKRFLAVYFIGGIAGNAVFILMNMSSFAYAFGASGAVYAIAGALAVLMPNLRVNMWFIVPMPLWVVVLVFFVLLSFVPGVNWQAHIGGLAVGLVAGFLFRKSGRYYNFR